MAIERAAQLLIELRVKAGLSRRKLGDKAGVHRTTIGRFEKGERGIDIKSLQRLAEALGVPVSVFLEPEPAIVLHKRSVQSLLREAQERYETLQVIEVPVVGSAPGVMPENVEEANMGYLQVPRGELPERDDSFFALRVGDQALEGDGIREGDFVIVCRDREIIDGKVYAVRLGEAVMLRHIHPEGAHLVLAASCPGIQPLLVPAGDVEILGRVVLSGAWQRH